MLKLILKQANWGVMGAVFGFAVGFFVKIYLIDIVGLSAWGKYVTAQTFSSISETFLSIGIPYVIIKFIPSFVESNKEKASRIANVFLKYAFIVGCVYLALIYFGSSYINHFIYKDIDDLYAVAMKHGALGGKLLGAGGGGFFLFYCRKREQNNLRMALNKLKEVEFSFEDSGSMPIGLNH